MLVSAHIAQDSDTERPTKVASKSRKHGIDIHFTKKTETAKYACELQGLLAEYALAKEYLEQKSLVTW